MLFKQTFYIISLLLLSGFAAIHQEWNIDKNFSIRFEDRLAKGAFETLSGSVNFDPQDLAASGFDVSVEVKSINTGNKLKNKHAQGHKWFDAEKYPVISFTSDSIYRSDSIYVARGVLRIKEVTDTIHIPFSFDEFGDSVSFKGRFRINRTDFGIGAAKGDEKDSTTLTVIVPAIRVRASREAIPQ